MPFKHQIVFGMVKPDMTVKEALDKMKEISEKHGLKIRLMGVPTGMRDQVIVVWDVDEGIDKFYAKMFEINSDWPLVDGRSHAVFVL